MHVHDVGSRERRRERPPMRQGTAAARLLEGPRPRRRPRAAAPRSPVPRACARAAGARGGCATYSTVSPASSAQFPSCHGQQRIGRLVRRQMRRDVEDVHSACSFRLQRPTSVTLGTTPASRQLRSRCSATTAPPHVPRQLLVSTRRSSVAELRERHRPGASFRSNDRNRSSRSQNASSSACVRLYGLPPTIASLEWNRRFSTGSSAAREVPRERRSCPRATSTTAAAIACATMPSARSTRLVVYGRGARA